MKIVTNEFVLSKDDYFMILVGLMLRRRWMVFVFLLFFSSLGIETGFFSVLLLFVLLSTAYLIYLIFISWIQTNPKANAILFTPRYCELDPEFIASYLKDGSLFKIKFEYIKRCIKKKAYCLFFFSKNQFVYLPLSALPAAKDLDALNMLLKVKTLK